MRQRTASNLEPMYVKIPADLHKRLKARARRERRTKTELVRNALTNYLLLIDRSEES